MGPNPVRLVSLLKGEICTETCAQGKCLCEDEGRDQGDVSLAKEHHRLPADHQK